MITDVKNVKMMKGISACLVLYNEEKCIRRCLDNIKGFVDEIIVLHDGKCSDNTLKIAKEYDARIFIRPHIGEAEPHRNYSFQKARYEWILQIDADEYLSLELKKKIRSLIKDENVNAYAFKWDLYCYNGKSIYDYKMALFRKKSMRRFLGIPHEAVTVNGVTKKSDLELVHKPTIQYHTGDFFKRKYKWVRPHAEHLIMKGKANSPAIVYFFKAIALFFFYFIYTIIRYRNYRVSSFAASYNFLVWWNVFTMRCKGKKQSLRAKLERMKDG